MNKRRSRYNNINKLIYFFIVFTSSKIELIFINILFFLKILLLNLLFSFSVNASLSSVTANTIQGHVPSLTFDGGGTQVSNMDDLLWIKLSNDDQYTKINNSSPSNPIELPTAGETLANVKMAIPDSVDIIDLKTLISQNHYFHDSEGDGENTDGINATGDLKVTITDISGNNVSRTARLNPCVSPYKITLTSDAGTLSTQYGDPNNSHYDASNAIYYIKPKLDEPIVCYAQPNLQYSSINMGGLSSSTYYNLDGPSSEWDPAKGFKLQNIESPSSNFPTTGVNKVYFNLTTVGPLSSNVTYSKSPSTSTIELDVNTSGNTVKVTLKGPKSDSSQSVTSSVVPTTFELYSGTTKIYSFMINKWFIIKPGNSGGYNANYCRLTYGNDYHVPHIVEYTNANARDFGWTGGLANQPNNYQRRIGGGLFAEWGKMHTSTYPGTDFDTDLYGYWAFETNGTRRQYAAGAFIGNIGYNVLNDAGTRMVCVK